MHEFLRLSFTNIHNKVKAKPDQSSAGVALDIFSLY